MLYLSMLLCFSFTQMDAMVRNVSQNTTQIQIRNVHSVALGAHCPFAVAIVNLQRGYLQDMDKNLQQCYGLLEGLRLFLDTRACRNYKITTNIIVCIDHIMKKLQLVRSEINIMPVNLPGIVQHLAPLEDYWHIMLILCRELPFQYSLRSAL